LKISNVVILSMSRHIAFCVLLQPNKMVYLLCLLTLCKNKMSFFLCKKASWKKEDEYWLIFLGEEIFWITICEHKALCMHSANKKCVFTQKK